MISKKFHMNPWFILVINPYEILGICLKLFSRSFRVSVTKNFQSCRKWIKETAQKMCEVVVDSTMFDC